MRKTDFFEENRRFSSQIKSYALRMNEPQIEGDLWAFLWLLLQRPNTPKDDRYIARSLKNKAIEIYREKKKTATFEQPLVDNLSTNFHTDIDFFDLLKPLSDREKKVLTLRYLYGFSVVEISMFLGVSRQYVNKIKNKAFFKLRDYVI